MKRGRPSGLEISYNDLTIRLERIEQALLTCRRLSDHLLATEANLAGMKDRSAQALAHHAQPDAIATEADSEIARRRLLTVAELARELGVCQKTVHNLRKTTGFPPTIRVSGRRIGFRQYDVDEWLAARGRRG